MFNFLKKIFYSEEIELKKVNGKYKLTEKEKAALEQDAAMMDAVKMFNSLNNPNPRPLDELFPNAVSLGEVEYWASIGNLAQVKNALNNGHEVNQKSSKGSTALHGAVMNGNFEVVKLLIDAGADINALFSGKTAAELAKEYKHLKIYDYLIACENNLKKYT